MDKFDNSDDFFDWFLGVIESHVPAYKQLVANNQQEYIAAGLPKLTSDQMTYMFDEIRRIIEIPDNIFLVYNSSIQTYFSRYNPDRKRLEIGVPTYAYYHLRYDPIIKAAIQHEMGHILNRDYAVNTKGHSGCANRCMDIRINHHIDREWLRDLFDAVYYFRAKPNFPMLVPEDTLPNYGLRMKKHGTYSFEVIHKYYHMNDADKAPKKPKPPKEYVMPEVGDVVKIAKSGKYGIVTDVLDGKAVVTEMTPEEVNEYFKDQKEGEVYTPIK